MILPLRNIPRLAFGIATALTLIVTVFVAPATANGNKATDWKQAADELLDYGQPQASAKNKTSSDNNVKAVGEGPQGEVVILIEKSGKSTADDAENYTRKALKKKYGDDVRVREVGSLEPKADTDVVGGAGIHMPSGEDPELLCTLGFAAWDSSGDPAVVTAGHCTGNGIIDGTDGLDTAGLNVPKYEDAAGDGDRFEFLHHLGSFGSWQFGDSSNSSDDGFSVDATDFGLIDVDNDDLDLAPEVTDWTTPDDLSKETHDISRVGSINPSGANIEKSGRTTGHTEAPASSIDIVDGVMEIGDEYPVRGFGIDGFEADQGDSGSPVYQDETAIGVLSAGGTGYMWAASIEEPLQASDGYSLQLHIDAPTVDSPENGGSIGAGEKITGSAKPGSTLVIKPDGGERFTVDVDGSGNWSFSAPDEFGTYTFSLLAKDGFDESDTVDHEVDVIIPAPKFTSPADGEKVAGPVSEVHGTGTPGAHVSLSGAVDDAVQVDDDGEWSAAADLDYGTHKYLASQTLDDAESTETSAEVTVIPAAPRVTTPKDGESFSADAAPNTVKGTGINGGKVTVKLDGNNLGAAEVDNGKWAVELPDRLKATDHEVSTVQEVDDATSSTSNTIFTVSNSSARPGGGGNVGTDHNAGHLTNGGGYVADMLPSAGAVGGLVTALCLGLLLIAGGAATLRGRRTAG